MARKAIYQDNAQTCAMMSKKMIPSDVIEMAIELLKHPSTRIVGDSNWIETSYKYFKKFNFGLFLRYNGLEFHHFGIDKNMIIPLDYNFAPNMDQFVFLLRCKFPDFYNKWHQLAKGAKDGTRKRGKR